jgi:hypothetical protein
MTSERPRLPEAFLLHVASYRCIAAPTVTRDKSGLTFRGNTQRLASSHPQPVLLPQLEHV